MVASSAATTVSLVGRDTPRRRVAAMLHALHQGSGDALVITGEPGIGKTALLEYAAAEARGCTVLHAVGVNAESGLPFVALGDVLRPLFPLLHKLPPPQAQALRIALALEAAETPAASYAICMATLTLLTTAAESRPVLVLTDDVHWLDPASAAVLSFAARRLTNDPVGMLFAARDGPPAPLDVRGLERLALRGLDIADSCRLITQLREVVIAPPVAGRLWQATGGNPLALRDMALRLDVEQLAGDRPLPEALPLGADLTRAFTDQIGPLPPDTRTALLALALAAGPEVPVLMAALDELGLAPAVLDPADAAGLIVIEGNRVRFSHPLVRSAVESTATGWARQRVYRALIASADGNTCLSYRAAAAIGADDQLADELVEAAGRMRARAALAAAAGAMHRAAQLATDPERRARLLLQAASDALGSGSLDDAIGWLDEARTLTRSPLTTADIDLMRGRLFTVRGTPAIAERVLATAAQTVATTDPGRAARLLCEAALPIFTEGRIRAAEESCRRAVRLAEASGHPPTLAASRAVLAQAQVIGGHLAGVRPHLDTAAAALDPAADLLLLGLIGACFSWLEEHETARRVLDRVIDTARRNGEVGTLSHALNYRSEVDRCTGDWTQAYAGAEEALRLARELRIPVTMGFSQVLLARLDAASGRADLVAERLEQATQMSGPLGTGGLAMWEGGVWGLLHLATGAPDRAITPLAEVRQFATANGIGNPNVVLWGPDLVEAYWRCGRTAEAADCLAELDEYAAATQLSTPRAAAERCHGVLATDPAEAEVRFAAAEALHRRVSNPFERARTQLCHAETLRRYRRRVAARPLLRTALRTFRWLGATPYAQRAAAELAATGEHAGGGDREVHPIERLTPQELQVAMAVARGLSNPEAAAALFISRKTVEAHLSGVYRKLDLSSRTQLVRFFATATIDPG